MAEDKRAHLTVGAISRNAILEEFIAGAASLPLWMPVIITAAATATQPATVNVSAIADDPLVVGVVVGGANMDAENAYANKEQGDLVLVCVFGPCKCYVDGGTTDIAIGDGLATDVTSGYGIKGKYTELEAVFAKALMISTEDGDIIEIFVGMGGTVT